MKILRKDVFDVLAEEDTNLKGLIGEYLFEKYVREGRLPFRDIKCERLELVCSNLTVTSYLRKLQQILGDNLIELLTADEPKALHEVENLVNHVKSIIGMNIHVEPTDERHYILCSKGCIFCSKSAAQYIEISVEHYTTALNYKYYAEKTREHLSKLIIPDKVYAYVCRTCAKRLLERGIILRQDEHYVINESKAEGAALKAAIVKACIVNLLIRRGVRDIIQNL